MEKDYSLLLHFQNLPVTSQLLYSPLSSASNLSFLSYINFQHYGRPGFNPWFGKIPHRRTWQPTPVFLPGESPQTEKPGRLQSTGCKESDMTEWLSTAQHAVMQYELILSGQNCTSRTCRLRIYLCFLLTGSPKRVSSSSPQQSRNKEAEAKFQRKH